MSGTEEQILSTIPDLGDSSSGGSSGGTSTSGDSGPAQTSAPPTGGGTSASPTGREGTRVDAAKPQTPVQRRHDGLLEVPNPQNPNTRDLVDPISGRVVAQGGIERRVFEEGQRHARENQTLKQQLQQLTQYAQGVGEVTREAQRLNVNPENQVIALRVMADFMRDPVRTLQYLVEEVKSKGYPIPFLEQGISPGMDLNAVAKMIDNKMMPLTQAQRQQHEYQQARVSAQRTLDSFISEHQEAQVNLDVIAEMLQSQPQLSLENAYLKMISWSRENGLDHTQSLKQQIARAYQRANQQPTQPTAPRNTRPLPNGRSATTGNVPATNAVSQYSENASWADIIRHSMQESGINLS